MWSNDGNDAQLAWNIDDDDDDDVQLAKALEESRRFYKEVEEPRLSQLQVSVRDPVAGPSTSREFQTLATDGPSSSKSALYANGPSSSRATTSYAKQNCTSKDGDENSEQLYYGPDANGFCLSEGKHWIYPTNEKFPIRTYQKSIVEKALFNNTLVSLPTGLGKTFIAAVVMYNYYNWYPKGKVIFMAPTKPLVAQQIDNCCNIMGIPRTHTAEMTGAMHSKDRAAMWQDKRVFFLTPQIVQNDLSAGICPASDVKCVVIDEAHRAVGDYAYTLVIRSLNSFEARFRVLALSATPGSDLQAVQKVVNNLMINHIELRNEQSPDLLQYTHQRNVEVMVVQVGPTILKIQEKYMEIIQLYSTRLQQRKLLFGNVRTMARFSCLRQWDDFRREGSQNMDPATAAQMNCDFSTVCTLIQGMELLQTYGLRLLLNHLKGVLNGKGNDATANRLNVNEDIKALMEEIEVILNPIDIDDDDDNNEEVPRKKQIIYGHPKLDRLHQVVVSHFEEYERKGSSTRAIIFCEYREGVIEINDMLKKFEPLVKPVSFMGQASGKTSKGITQKQQLEIMEKFRKGTFNTLVSTSVGEEGLDIGEVDLIICFDAKNSPIRQVQRMGRTGRKREGRIIMLMTQGKEERKYKESLWKKNNVNSALLSAESLSGFLYDNCPRLLPPGIEPKCIERAIEVAPNKVPSKQQDLRKMLLKKSTASTSAAKNVTRTSYLSEEELQSIRETWDIQKCCQFNCLPLKEEMWTWTADEIASSKRTNTLDISDYLEYLRFEQRTHIVDNSSDTRMLVDLLTWADDRRDREQGTQCAVFAQEATSTQMWPSKGRKRNRVTAGMTDDKDDRPTKVRKRGRPKKTDTNICAPLEEHGSPEPTLEDLSNDFIKSKRPQFIEDEDEPPPHETEGPFPHLSPKEVSAEKGKAESLNDIPAVLDSDEDNVSTPNQMLFGSQLSKQNCVSGLLKALDRQLPLETDDCDICENLFPCESVNSLIIQNKRPFIDLSWAKVRLSLQAAVKLLPSMTKDNFKKFSAQATKSPSYKEEFISQIPRNDEFYSYDFDGGLICGGLGDCSPPDGSHRKSDQNDNPNLKPITDISVKSVTEYGGNKFSSKFVEIDGIDSMQKQIDVATPSHSISEVPSVPQQIERVQGIDVGDKEQYTAISLHKSGIISGDKEEVVSQGMKHLKDSSYQHIMDDSFNFLGLSKLDDIFESPKGKPTIKSNAEDSCINIEKPAAIDKSTSSIDKTLSSSKLMSPVGENASDSSQVSPILGSQLKRRTRRPGRIRKLSLGFCDQNDENNIKLTERTESACGISKIEREPTTTVLQSETPAPRDTAAIVSPTSPLCDFNICDDSLFEMSQDLDQAFSKSSKVDESVKEAVRSKALEIMSKPPRTLTQQFREMCDSSLCGFTQVLDLLDSKTNKVSPNYKLARADSSTSVGNENIAQSSGNALEKCQARSPDLFDDDLYSDEFPADSSVPAFTDPVDNTCSSSHANIKPDCANSKQVQTSSIALRKTDFEDVKLVNEEEGTKINKLENEEEGVKVVTNHPKKCLSPVFSQSVFVKKPSKLSLKNRKAGQHAILTTESKKPDYLIPKENLKVEEEAIRIGTKLHSNVMQVDFSVFGDEFNSSWVCPLNEGTSEKYSSEADPQVDDKANASKTSGLLHHNQVRCNDGKDMTLINNAHLDVSPPVKNEFEVALEQLDAVKKRQKRLSLSRGVSSSSNSNINLQLMKPSGQTIVPQSVKFLGVTKNEKIITIDDDSPVKAPVRKKSSALNITTSSEEGCNLDSYRKIRSDGKENNLFVCQRKQRHLSSSSDDDLQESGWLCAKKKVGNSRKKNGEPTSHPNAEVERGDSFLDLTTFCDDTLLSPLKDDVDSKKQGCSSIKENVHSGKHPESNLQKEKIKRKRKTKRNDGLKKKCAFVESEAEESANDAHNSSDGESTSLDELDSSFIDDSQPETTQGVVDIHAKYLESVKSPARGAGGFKIPRNVHPVDINVYSQYPDASELNQSYANDSFCVDDEPTQYENNEMSLLEIAEARLKARRKEKRKRRKKNVQSTHCCKEEEEVESENSDEGIESIKTKPHKKRRLIILDDSDSNDEVLEVQAKITVQTIEQKSPVGNSSSVIVKDRVAEDIEFAKLLENDEDFDFFMDPNLPSVNGTSEVVTNIATSSPIRPSTFVKKSRVAFSDVSKPIKSVAIPLSNHQRPETSKEFLTKASQSVLNVPRSSHIVPGPNRAHQYSSTKYASVVEVQGVPTSSKISSLVIIVSSRQVASFPELIRVLRVTHKVTISPRSISNADFIVSWRLGIIRTFVSDLKDRKKLELVARNLKEYFCRPFLIVEKDRVKPLVSSSHSKKKSTCDTAPKPVWTSANCTTMALLRQAGIQLLFAQDKDETAGLIAKLASKEKDKGHYIPELPHNLSDDVENRLQFFSSLPCINLGLALKLLVKYPSISQFLTRCSTVLEIASTVGLDIAAARKIHNMLCEVHVSP